LTVATKPLPWQRSKTYLRAMPREATTIEIMNIRTKSLAAGVVRTGAETGVPTRFQATITLARPALTVRLEVRCALNNPAEIRKVEITPRVGSITASSVRALALEHLLRQSLAAAQIAIEPRADIGPDAFQLTGDAPDVYRMGDAKRSAHQQRADELAAQAAVFYQEAVAQGRGAPAEAVAAALHKSRSQVARYIRRARELNLIPPLAQGARDGE
jgi:hypothetical protein